MNAPFYALGRHSSDLESVHVALIESVDGDGDETRDELFDVTLYDPNYVANPATGETAYDQSLAAIERLVGLANAALAAGLDPVPAC